MDSPTTQSDQIITEFPRFEKLSHYEDFKPTAGNVARIEIKDDFIVEAQKPDYSNDAYFRAEGESKRAFIEENKLRFLHSYQVRAMYDRGKTNQSGQRPLSV